MSANDEPTAPDPGDDAALPIGRRYGRYEVLGRLGVGGMGSVLEARDPALGRKVALNSPALALSLVEQAGILDAQRRWDTRSRSTTARSASIAPCCRPVISAWSTR